jgi:hypothetical protein
MSQAPPVADYARNTAQLVQALREHDFGGKILVTSAFAAPDVLREVGRAAEAVLVTQTAMPPAVATGSRVCNCPTAAGANPAPPMTTRISRARDRPAPRKPPGR